MHSAIVFADIVVVCRSKYSSSNTHVGSQVVACPTDWVSVFVPKSLLFSSKLRSFAVPGKCYLHVQELNVGDLGDDPSSTFFPEVRFNI
jgi:hypothetical protein